MKDRDIFSNDYVSLFSHFHSDGAYCRESAESQEQQAYVRLAIYELNALLGPPKPINRSKPIENP